jgi:hypothetical protein
MVKSGVPGPTIVQLYPRPSQGALVVELVPSNPTSKGQATQASISIGE